jgi:hypothetical protein
VARLVTPGTAIAAPGPQPAEGGSGADARTHPHADRALAQLHGLETALTHLAVPLRRASRTELAA